MNTNTKEINIIAYPYAVQPGIICVPEDLSDDEFKNYIEDHWGDIDFGKPDLDYCGTDFEVIED